MTRDLERYRRVLLAERAALLAQFAGSNPRLAEIEPMNDEDWAPFSHDRFVSVRISTLDDEKLHLIDLALERLASGEFGKCADCGKPISERRLDVIPWASRCVACQERLAELQDGASNALAAS
jgi:DnaK suppressor protein